MPKIIATFFYFILVGSDCVETNDGSQIVGTSSFWHQTKTLLFLHWYSGILQSNIHISKIMILYFLSFKDILSYALKIMSDDELDRCQSDETSEFLAILKQHKGFSEVTCGQVANSSQRDTFIQSTHFFLCRHTNLFFLLLFCVTFTKYMRK